MVWPTVLHFNILFATAYSFMKNFSKSPRVVKKMVSPPRVPVDSKVITGKTDKMISQPHSVVSTSNLPLSTKVYTSSPKISSQPKLTHVASADNKQYRVEVNDPSISTIIRNTQSKIKSSTGSSSPRPAIKIDEYGLEYLGSLFNDLFDGEGVLYDPKQPKDRYIYKGQWREGARNGYGHYIYPDHSEYTGQWLNNLKHGKGKLISKEGQYDGEWEHGSRSGLGIMRCNSPPVTLSGQWINNEFAGGKITYEDGTTYNGPVRDYQRDGHGQYEYADNSKYSGDWVLNKKHGRGTYLFSNNDAYEGSFQDGRKSGRGGRYSWKTYDGYELVDAEFKNDQLVGGKILNKKNKKLISI